MDRDVSQGARPEPTLPAGAPRLRLAGPAGQSTVEVETHQPVTLVGSRRDCDLFVEHRDVSRIHCALVNTGTSIIATDLCSRSGTFVNGQRSSAVALKPGDELRLGSVSITIEFLEGQPADEGEPSTALPTPLRLTGAEQTWELAALPVVIGRRHACKVVLDTPDVSLTHALLLRITGCPAVFDLGSRSGTYLNDQRVTLAWLRDGDRISIGGEELTLGWDGPVFVEPEQDRAGATGPLDAAGPPEGGGWDDLDGLETILAGLKARIEASQTRLRERAAALDRREAELEQRTGELERREQRVFQELGRVEQEAAELRVSMANLEDQRSDLAVEQERLAGEGRRLAAQSAEMEHREQAYGSRLRELEQRQAALDQRAAALLTAEQQLAGRQTALEQREAAAADAARQIQQFKAALHLAQQAFDEAGSPLLDGPIAAPGTPPLTNDG